MEEGARPTLPPEASMSLKGHQRTEAREENKAGSCGVADGYQRKSRIDAGCGKGVNVFNWKNLFEEDGSVRGLSRCSRKVLTILVMTALFLLPSSLGHP